MDIEDIVNSTNILKGFGYLFFLGLLMIMGYLNGYHMKDKTPLLVFALITCLIFTFIPYGVNRDCDGEYTEYFCLGYIDNKLDEYEEAEKIGISLQRSFWNGLITLIFFGFAANAIATNVTGKTAFSGGSTRTTVQPNVGSNFKNLTVALSKPFSTMVYMAIVIIIINVISNIYIYFNCEDKNNDYNIRSFILGQYNVVLITIVGLVVYGVAKSNN
jgi:hypothetical protein